jgi:hypothetical protein
MFGTRFVFGLREARMKVRSMNYELRNRAKISLFVSSFLLLTSYFLASCSPWPKHENDKRLQWYIHDSGTFYDSFYEGYYDLDLTNKLNETQNRTEGTDIVRTHRLFSRRSSQEAVGRKFTCAYDSGIFSWLKPMPPPEPPLLPDPFPEPFPEPL